MSKNRSEKKNKKTEKSSQTGKRFFVDSLVVASVVFGVIYSVEFINKYNLQRGGFPGDSRAAVLGEEDQNKYRRDPIAQSENYQSTLITFGGNTAMPDNLKEVALKIEEVKSELLTTKDQEEIKLLISWKTNKTSISEIEYGRSANQLEKKVKESKYGYRHSSMLSSLDPATAYVYRIRSKDKWGNEKISENFAFYTGAPNVSLIDLLLGTFKDVFSWAIK